MWRAVGCHERSQLEARGTCDAYRGLDRDIRFAWVRALIKANKIIKMDLRKNNRHDMAARVPSNASAGFDKATS
jgi:hypothetical protein